METTVRTKEEMGVDYEVSSFALKVGMGMAAVIGIWGMACLFGGLVSAGGFVALTKTYFVALLAL